jgi:hypothetical protein
MLHNWIYSVITFEIIGRNPRKLKRRKNWSLPYSPRVFRYIMLIFNNLNCNNYK